MAVGPRPLRDNPRKLARALGVTRIARLTGLDRTGVEVASAVRPRGHVLQVTNGKGETEAAAAAGALLEAAELAAAEAASADAWGSAAELRARRGPGAVLSPRALDPGGDEGWDRVRLAWRAGRDLASGAPVLVPAHAVHVPPAGGPWLGPALVRWTSNGMGASPDPAAALLHALLEAVERDRVARALPEGFTPGALRRRLVDPATLARAAPRTAALLRRIEAGPLRGFLLDLGDRGDLGLPAAAALLLDVEGGPVPVAAGYACRLDRDAALAAALLEAAQSRATEIHGAREDVLVGDRRAAEALRGILEAARPTRPAAALPDLRARTPAAGVRAVVRRLVQVGVRPVAIDLPGPPGVAVTKVVAPGLLLSELL